MADRGILGLSGRREGQPAAAGTAREGHPVDLADPVASEYHDDRGCLAGRLDQRKFNRRPADVQTSESGSRSPTIVCHYGFYSDNIELADTIPHEASHVGGWTRDID